MTERQERAAGTGEMALNRLIRELKLGCITWDEVQAGLQAAGYPSQPSAENDRAALDKIAAYLRQPGNALALPVVTVIVRETGRPVRNSPPATGERSP